MSWFGFLFNVFPYVLILLLAVGVNLIDHESLLAILVPLIFVSSFLQVFEILLNSILFKRTYLVNWFEWIMSILFIGLVVWFGVAIYTTSIDASQEFAALLLVLYYIAHIASSVILRKIKNYTDDRVRFLRKMQAQKIFRIFLLYLPAFVVGLLYVAPLTLVILMAGIMVLDELLVHLRKNNLSDNCSFSLK